MSTQALLAPLASPAPALRFIDACALDALLPWTGACALINGRQVALFRFGPGNADDTVYALSNYDPFSRAFVLSRGILGDEGGVPKVASPLYKQRFDLRSGQCLDDAAVRVPAYPVRVIAGRIEVGDERQS